MVDMKCEKRKKGSVSVRVSKDGKQLCMVCIECARKMKAEDPKLDLTPVFL